MNQAGFRNLTLLAVLLAVGAVWAWSSHAHDEAPPGAGEKLFPELTEALNEVDQVVAEGSNGTPPIIVLPLRKARLTPASRAAATLAYISRVQYSS